MKTTESPHIPTLQTEAHFTGLAFRLSQLDAERRAIIEEMRQIKLQEAQITPGLVKRIAPIKPLKPSERKTNGSRRLSAFEQIFNQTSAKRS